MNPLIRAWLGQRTTILGIAGFVAATVALATRQITLEQATVAYSAALTAIGLPEGAVSVKQTEPVTVQQPLAATPSPPAGTAAGSGAVPVHVVGDIKP